MLVLKKVKLIMVIVLLNFGISRVNAHINMNDSAENLVGATITTKVDFNNPKTRAAHAYLKLGILGEVYEFVPEADLVNFQNLLEKLVEEKKIKINDEFYLVETNILQEWDESLLPNDVNLPKGNKYPITKIKYYESDYLELDIKPIYTFEKNDKHLMLRVYATRGILKLHHCSKKDSDEIKEWCKKRGSNSVYYMDTNKIPFKVGELMSVLDPIFNFDLSSIPRLDIPKN